MKSVQFVLGLLAALSFNLTANAQDVKSQLKSTKAFISIAYQDVKGEGINSSIGKQYEKSFNAFGDKTIMTSILMNDLLNQAKPEPLHAVYQDAAYQQAIQSCPVISAHRAADPYLMCMANFLDLMLQDTGSLESKFLKATEWQRKNAPHAPGGLNEAPASLSEKDEMEWGKFYSANWMKNHADEYRSVLERYTRNYNLWKAKNKNGTHRAYIEKLIGTLSPELSKSEAVYFVPEKTTKTGIALPDAEFMHKNPAAFVNNLYESVLLRKAKTEETDFLVQYIRQHPDLKPAAVYYALMTSKEYSFY